MAFLATLEIMHAEYFFAVSYLFYHLVLSLPFKMRSWMVLYDFLFISYGHF